MRAPPRVPERYDPTVRVLPPDASWALRFEREAARLRAALAGVATRVEHIGSTAVDGLASTPILDVQVSVPALAPHGSYARPLARLGYVPFPARAARAGDRPRFAKPPRTPHAFHLYVCADGGADERRRLALRDYLRAHPEAATAYAELKRALVARRPLDALAYARGKARRLRALEREALAWAPAASGA